MFQVFTEYSETTKLGFNHSHKAFKPVATEPLWHDRFRPFKPVISCPKNLVRYGSEGDGGKWLCGIESLKRPCSIISLGSFQVFDFEEAMLNQTPCNVYTFDCTSEARTLNDRHRYFKRCIGVKRNGDASFVSLDEAIELTGDVTPSILKMDIEGWEFDVLSMWNTSYKHLPAQLSFEVHFQHLYYGSKYYKNRLAGSHETLVWPGISEVTMCQLSLLFFHLANLGYGIVNQEPNYACGYCSEFTLMRVERT
jgi:Methyltransferase domain